MELKTDIGRKWLKREYAAGGTKQAGKKPPKNWQSKYKEPAVLDTTNLPELPEGWCWPTVEQVLHIIEAGKSFKCLTRPTKPDEWGIIKVSATTWGEFDEDETEAIPPEKEFNPADEFKKDNVFFSSETEGFEFEIRVMDHTHCITNGRELTARAKQIGIVKDELIYGLFPEFKPLLDQEVVHTTYEQLSNLDGDRI